MQEPDPRERAHAVDTKGGRRPSPPRRDRDLDRAVRHAAHPLGGTEHRAVHRLHEGRAGPGLEANQGAHGIGEEARRIAQPDPAVPGDEFHRLGLQPSGVARDGVRLGRDLEVRNEAQRRVRSRPLHCRGRFPAIAPPLIRVTAARARRPRDPDDSAPGIGSMRQGSGAAPRRAEAAHAPLRPDVAVTQGLPPADTAAALIRGVVARRGAIWSIVSISPDRRGRYQHQRGEDHRDRRKPCHLTAP